ncbi:MAG TPA: glycosyltransferase family 1 protein [Terriglobia bacterium]|nr:glycosyltransferase family 1 protein [Terriglobia bacterium]
MACIALDATYTVDPEPSGVAVYSRRLIEALSLTNPRHRFLLCYRLSRLGQRKTFLCPAKPSGAGGPCFSIRMYQEHLTFWLPWQASLFHSLAQRPPAFHFKKEVVTVFDIFPITGRDYSAPDFQRKFAALLREAVARAARVITLSEYTAGQLVAHLQTPREKISVIPGGVDIPANVMSEAERDQERERWVGQGNEMILSVGVLQTRKNTINALRALQSLPPNYRMVWAGGNGHGSDAIHDFIRKEGLASRVVTPGYVAPDRLPALYQAASVFLFPSFEEGFGFPVLEAMTHGIPVVAANTSSLPEVGGDAALYADPHDPAQIAAQTRRVVEDVPLRENMIGSGLSRVREFSWSKTAEATLKVYDEVLAR